MCWIVLKIIKDVFTFRIIYWNLCKRRRPNSQWSNPICCLSYPDNIMSADALATLGAKSIIRHGICVCVVLSLLWLSGGFFKAMIEGFWYCLCLWSFQSRNIPSPASKELTDYLSELILTWSETNSKQIMVLWTPAESSDCQLLGFLVRELPQW